MVEPIKMEQVSLGDKLLYVPGSYEESSTDDMNIQINQPSYNEPYTNNNNRRRDQSNDVDNEIGRIKSEEAAIRSMVARLGDDYDNECFRSHIPANRLEAMKQIDDFESGRAGAPKRANLFTKAAFSGPDWMQTPWLLLPASIIIPSAFTVLLFGEIPLGLPNIDSFCEKRIYLFVLNPIVYLVFSMLIVVVFYACLDELNPWRSVRYYVPFFVLSYIAQVTVMSIIYSQVDTFPLMGIIPFVLTVTLTLLSLKAVKRWSWVCGCKYYLVIFKEYKSIIIAIAVYVVVLAAWVMAYRVSGTGGQFALPFALLFLVFGWKKFILHKSNLMPLEMAMLISGLWLENLDDTFQTIIFPVVASPGPGYAALWIRKMAENVAYMGFLTDTWFRFRVWIKGFLKRCFCCRWGETPTHPIELDLNTDDRGHSNQKPGYLRRQVQFFIFKIFSQIAAACFYLCVTPILRWGDNSKYYPLSEPSTTDAGGLETLTADRYRNSMIFACANLFSTLVSAAIGYWFIKEKRREIFFQISKLYNGLLREPRYFGFVLAIISSSQLLTVSVVLYHNRVWYFSDAEPAELSGVDLSNSTCSYV